MKKTLVLLTIIVSALNVKAQIKPDSNIFLPAKLVNLKGKEGVTVFKNSTADTVKLEGVFFNWLPYTETNFTLTLAPGSQDSVKLQFNYPDFIYVNGFFRVYNAPGGRLLCDIKQIEKLPAEISYTGDYALENGYYLSYNNYLKNHDNESRPYYKAGDMVTDWNKFPAMADSITQIRLDFLNSYKGGLSARFRKTEYQRLVYNGIFRKDNVLFSKEFYSGNKIPVKENYFDYMKDIKLANPNMVLNTEYLWVTDFYLNLLAKRVKKPMPDPVLYVIDSLCHDTKVADLLKMRRLYMLYTSAKDKYEDVISKVNFADNTNSTIVDSLIQVKLGSPGIGKMAPGITLTDIGDNIISLANFKGKYVILNFWATWCGPCIKEFPAENKLYKQYKDKDLAIINICVESDKAKWKQVSADKQLQMINLFAPTEVYSPIKKSYNLSALPRSILINKEGIVISNYYARAAALSVTDIALLLKNK